MITTVKFSPSINILRDESFDFHYIVTPNASNTFHQLFMNVLAGSKAHIIIGAYGSGKSSFLLALEQTLTKSRIHFKDAKPLLPQLPVYHFVNLVGHFGSLSEALAVQFGIKGSNYTHADIFKAIAKSQTALTKKGKSLAIVIDEFGKHLEFAGKNNPEAEMYFLQQLAEFINDPRQEALLITTLHQDFNAYSTGLTRFQQLEWDKVRGRFKDHVFNEPVEQLLFLASEHLRKLKKGRSVAPTKDQERLFNHIKAAKVFPLKDYLEMPMAIKLLPLDILAAAVLTMSLQRYGQNERSLFGFLALNETGESQVTPAGYFGVPQVYDYLINNFFAAVTNSRHASYSQWGSIKIALEKAEGVLPAHLLSNAKSFLKAVGLLNIFSSAAGKLDRDFYLKYGKLALGLQQPEDALDALERFKILKYTGYLRRYLFVDGTDLDIDLAIDEAGRLVEKVTSLTEPLNRYFDFPFLSAKAEFYQRGTPRFFQFKLTESPVILTPEDEVDGFINLVFSEDPNSDEIVQECSSKCSEAILYGCFRNTNAIRNTIFELQKVKKVIASNPNDKIAIRYLTEIEDRYILILNHQVLDSLFDNQRNVIWYYRGEEIPIESRHGLNKVLSSICSEVYSATPAFRNEMVNKTNVSAAISTARKKLIKKSFTDINNPDLGFKPTEFPPEKTIYLSLLKATGIHRISDGTGYLDRPEDQTFQRLWEICDQFLQSTQQRQRNLGELTSILLSKPLKLKHGFMNFWLPVFLISRMDDYALYGQHGYIPALNEDDIELILKKPASYSIKAFNIAGIRLSLFNQYRAILNQGTSEKPGNQTFIQTIRPFLSFYKELSDYTKQTARLPRQCIAIRNVIAGATDPEKVFFEEFPIALGFSLEELQDNPEKTKLFIKKLQDTIRELRNCQNELEKRMERFIASDILGERDVITDYGARFKKRFTLLKTELLASRQQQMASRLMADLDNGAWLNGVTLACIRKSKEKFADGEEQEFYEKLREEVYSLDNLCELGTEGDYGQNEEVLKLEITSLVHGLKRQLLRIPKSQAGEILETSNEFKKILKGNKKTKIAILTKLLEEVLNEA